MWKSRLHERLKMHLWRIAANVLPTKDVISQFANFEVGCPLCNLSDESSLHLFALCPIAKSLWFRSQWGGSTDSLGLASIHDLINFLFSPPFAEELTKCQRKDFLLFGAILYDVIWKQRNLSLLEGVAELLSSRISKLFLEHKSARLFVSSQAVLALSHQWTPPPISSIKINVDVTVGPHCSSIAPITRDWRGRLVFACSKRVNTILLLQVEAEAIKWALTLAANLEFKAIIIESDSQVCSNLLFDLEATPLGE